MLSGHIKPEVQGFHGRPMCCAKAMSPIHAKLVKRDQRVAQRYRCTLCRHVVRIYFDAPGVMSTNQSCSTQGLIPRRPQTPQRIAA